jgi:hypothetical protein
MPAGLQVCSKATASGTIKQDFKFPGNFKTIHVFPSHLAPPAFIFALRLFHHLRLCRLFVSGAGQGAIRNNSAFASANRLAAKTT